MQTFCTGLFAEQADIASGLVVSPTYTVDVNMLSNINENEVIEMQHVSKHKLHGKFAKAPQVQRQQQRFFHFR